MRAEEGGGVTEPRDPNLLVDEDDQAGEPPEPQATVIPIRGPEDQKAVAARLRADAATLRAENAMKAAKLAADRLAAGELSAEEKKRRKEAARAAGAATQVRVADDQWREGLLMGRDKDGNLFVKPVLSNVVTVLRYHPDWARKIGWDAFGERIVSNGALPWDVSTAPEKSETGAWTETDLSRVVDWLARNEAMAVWSKLVAEAVAIVAEANRVHPVLDYLENLPPWDGVPRMPTWLSTYAGAAQTEYTAAIGIRWMISAVARVKNPGCQADCMLIAEDRNQGSGKSSVFRKIVPSSKLYSETGITIGDKDSYQCLHGVWIYLIDELDSLKRNEVTKIKNFVSSMKDHYRPSYGRVARDFHRQNVFGGTTNETDYLVDRTGNRRFWPFRVVKEMDIAGVERDRDLLWAEALHRFNAGEPWHVNTPELRALCEAEQEERVHEEPWEKKVSDWIAEPTMKTETYSETGKKIITSEPYKIAPEGPTTTEILEHALGLRPDMINVSGSRRAADVLRALGYTVLSRCREGDARVRRYAKPGASPSQPPPSMTNGAATNGAAVRVAESIAPEAPVEPDEEQLSWYETDDDP